MDNEDLAIKCDILSQKVDDVEKAMAELKPQVVLCYEWVPWLHTLYRWLRAVFKHCPGWTQMEGDGGEWAYPGSDAGGQGAMGD